MKTKATEAQPAEKMSHMNAFVIDAQTGENIIMRLINTPLPMAASKQLEPILQAMQAAPRVNVNLEQNEEE